MTKTKNATINAVGKVQTASTGYDAPPVFATAERELSLAARVSALEGELVSTRAQASLLPLIKKNHGEISALHLSAIELNNLAAPWEMLTLALSQQLRGTESIPGLQLVSLPIDANWNDPIHGNYQLWRVIGDSIPLWGPTYRPSRTRLSMAYYTFLTNLDIPLPDTSEKPLADLSRMKYMNAMHDLKTAFMQASDNWKVFSEKQSTLPVDRQLNFEEWYNLFDGNKISTLQQRVKQTEQEFTAWLVKGFPGYTFIPELLSKFDDPSYQLSAFDYFDNVDFCRTFNVTPSLHSFVNDGKQMKNRPFEFSFTKLSPRTSIENTTWGGSSSWLEGFFSFGAFATGGRLAPDTSSEQFELRITFKNCSTFQVTPSSWFEPSAIRSLKNGPWLPDGPVAKNQFKLWAPEGVLSLLPQTFVVAYQPEVTIHVTPEDFHKIRSNYYAYSGFSAGPFGFGPAYLRRVDDVIFDDSTNTITARDTSDVPQILAAISLVTPDLL